MTTQTIKEYRRKVLKITQAEAAKKLGISQGVYHRWESGKDPVPGDRQNDFVKLFNSEEFVRIWMNGQTPITVPPLPNKIKDDETYYFGHVLFVFADGSDPLELPITNHQRYRLENSRNDFIQIETTTGKLVIINRRHVLYWVTMPDDIEAGFDDKGIENTKRYVTIYDKDSDGDLVIRAINSDPMEYRFSSQLFQYTDTPDLLDLYLPKDRESYTLFLDMGGIHQTVQLTVANICWMIYPLAQYKALLESQESLDDYVDTDELWFLDMYQKTDRFTDEMLSVVKQICFEELSDFWNESPENQWDEVGALKAHEAGVERAKAFINNKLMNIDRNLSDFPNLVRSIDNLEKPA